MSIDEKSHGLFGPGIFGTGIDLSALDEDTAFRLGAFLGEQMKAAGDRGYDRALTIARERVESLRANGDPASAWGAAMVLGDLERSRPAPAAPTDG